MAQTVVQIIDNTAKAFEAIERAKKAALKAIGAVAVNYAKRDCPVKTGRLKGSIGYEVAENEDAVYIGTDVEYAEYVEFDDNKKHPRGGKAHFLRDAATLHDDEYKKLTRDIMKNA